VVRADALWIVLRGNDIADGRAKVGQCELLKSPTFFPKDNYEPVMLSTSTRMFNKQEKSINVMANSQVIVKSLEDVLDRCHNMYESSAYLHQYLRAGVDREWINEDRLFLEQVLNEYKSMT
jgi:hypothetical protein